MSERQQIKLNVIEKMKKTYIKPSVECFNVNAHSIIAASNNPLALREGAGNEITNENQSSFDILGREDNAVSNVWDSEW